MSTAYVIYKGEQAIGTYLTLEDLATALNTSQKRASIMATPSFHKRQEIYPNTMIVEKVTYDNGQMEV